MSSPSVAAIVLNYNGRDLTLQTVASLLELEHEPLTIVVVDNGSTDGSYEAVGEAFPGVVNLRVETNRGISYGINHGIRWALERRLDYLLLLNNDIEVDPGMVRELLRVAESDPTVGCVGPKAYYYSDRGRIWSAGGMLRFREAVTRERGMLELDRGQWDRTEEVDYVNGCAMLVPRRVMEEVGPWDPQYFVSVEDADWCARMKALGYRCVYAHRAVLWHMVSPTTGGYTPGRTYNTGYSTALFVRRHGGFRQRCRFWLFFLASLPVAWLRELPRRNQAAATAKLRGVIAGWRAPLAPPPAFDGSGDG